MISASADVLSTLTAPAWTYRLRVESWLGGTLLDDDVPVASGALDADTSLNVPERLTLSVPRRDRGVNWAPTEEDSPLAANGQRLRVLLGVDSGRSYTTWIQRGWFLLQDAPTQGDTVSVVATNLLQLIYEARLVSPFQPTGTFHSAVRGLVEPALTVDLTAAPTNRNVPAAVNFDEDRLAGLYEVLDAWPATARVTPAGVLEVSPATTSTTPVLDLDDARNVVRAAGNTTRNDAYNAVVARGTAADGTQVQGVAYDRSSGPHRYGGPFNPLPVPYYFASPLITTVSQANASAATVLARITRQVSPAYDVEMITNPLVELGDVARLTTEDYGLTVGTVEKFRLPLTPDATMTATVRKLT